MGWTSSQYMFQLNPKICGRSRERQNRRRTDELREHAGVTWQRTADIKRSSLVKRLERKNIDRDT